MTHAYDKKISRRQFAAGMAAGAAVAATGLPRRAFAQGAPLKIGVLLPRSGYLAQAGQSCFRAVEIAPRLLADMGYKVEIVSADMESSVDVSRTRAEAMIADGAQILVGAFDSAGTLAIAQVCEQRGIPLVINIAAAPNITEQGYKTVFRNFMTSGQLVRNGLALMKGLFEASGTTPKTAVLLYANDTFGTANHQAINALLPQVGAPFQLVEQIAYDPRAKDLAIEIAKAKSTGAELALVTTRANDAILMVREMVKQRWEPQGIISPGSPGMYDEQFYKTLGKYADYAITNVGWYDPKADMSRRVEAGFASKYPNERFAGHGFNIGHTFEALLIAADAHKRAGSADPKALIEALRQTEIKEHMMIGGPIKFDEKGQNNNIRSATVQNLNGEPAVVLPAENAVAKPVYPMPGWAARG